MSNILYIEIFRLSYDHTPFLRRRGCVLCPYFLVLIC